MRPAMPPVWLLVFITLSGTLGVHIFMPALPDAARSLQVAPGAMQATISCYILGMAAGQPIYGPMSDCFGRRPVLLAGLALFTVGGLWSMAAPSVSSLAAARFMQALGGSAGMVLGRAIVRDTSDLEQSVRRLAMINLVMLIGPGLAPMVGQVVSSTFGWRYIFVLLAAVGAVDMLLTAWLLPETASPSRTLHLAGLWRDHRQLLLSRRFLGMAIGGGCATTSTYAFFAAAPFIFIEELHRPADELALYLGLMILGAAVGNMLIGRLMRVLSIDGLMLAANGAGMASAALLCLSIWAGFFGWQLTLGTLLLYTLVAGMLSPMVVTKAMSVDPRMVGSAAGLYGAIQMSVGALCTWLAGLGSDPAASVGWVLLGAAMISQVAFRVSMRAPGADRGH